MRALAAMSCRLGARLPIDGQPVMLVTHRVVVNAFTEATPPAGGGSTFQRALGMLSLLLKVAMRTRKAG
jgi:hypothetical protein